MEPEVLTAQRDEMKNVLEVVNGSLSESYNVNFHHNGESGDHLRSHAMLCARSILIPLFWIRKREV